MKPVILITGASRGIGAATALLAATKGYAVAVNYASNAQAAESVVAQIRAQSGTAIAVQADVADEAQVQAMFKKVDAELGPLSALVNNAGIVDVTARVDEISVARWQRMFNITVSLFEVAVREDRSWPGLVAVLSRGTKKCQTGKSKQTFSLDSYTVSRGAACGF